MYYAYCSLASKTSADCDAELLDSGGASGTSGFLDDSSSLFPYRYINVANENTDDYITFHALIDSAQSASAGKDLVISIFAKTDDSKKNSIVPIRAASVDAVKTNSIPTSCNNICQDQFFGTSGTSYRAVRVSAGKYVRFGILMTDLCLAAQGAGDGQGCSGATPDKPDNTTVVQQRLYVVIGEVDSGKSLAARTDGKEEVELEVRFHNKLPTYSCADPGNMYFPSDGAIIIQNSQINYNLGLPLGSPQKSYLVLADTTSLGVTRNSYNNNDVVFRATGSSPSVSGFNNTTDGTDNQYSISISVQDYSGVVAAYNGSCAVTNATTSSIQGIVSDGECFVATGTFRQLNNPSLKLLRRFRDDVLRKFDLGILFVDFYYQNGPHWAKWLIDYPVLRVPVFLLLLPLQLFALLILNPIVAISLFLAGTGFGLFLFKKNGQCNEEKCFNFYLCNIFNYI